MNDSLEGFFLSKACMDPAKTARMHSFISLCLFEMVTTATRVCMRSLIAHHQSQVSFFAWHNMWAANICANTRTQELGRIAPYVMFLFKRPKLIQASQFMAVVETLVTFAQDPELFFRGFKALTVCACVCEERGVGACCWHSCMYWPRDT